MKEQPEKRHSAALKLAEFLTENGIKLEMTRSETIANKGRHYIENGKALKYVIDDFKHSSFLQQYNMPLYFSLFEFDETDRLVKYTFGFEYP